MKRFLITLHRWLGYPLGIIFAVTILTGILSGIDDLLDMLVNHGPVKADRVMT